MTERERLLAILNIPIYPHEGVDPVEALADFLLDYGVKVPVMCKECKDARKEIALNKKVYFMCKHTETCHSGNHFCSYGATMDK